MNRQRLAPANGDNADKTLPTDVIEVAGKKYTICMDIGTLIDAEEELNAAGHNVSLLLSLPPLSASKTRRIFAIALRKFHPEITFEEAMGILDLPALYKTSDIFSDLWLRSTPQAKEGGEATENPSKSAE